MKHNEHWMANGGDDPAAHVVDLIAAMRARWPLAWEAGAPLPDAPRFVSLFAGLVTLADWMGSDTTRFPVGAPHGEPREALRVERARAMVVAHGLAPLSTPDTGFEAALGYPPHGFQREAAAADLGPVALIEAETGSGKTEAALWRWLELRRRGEVDGLYFALPTRSAALQLHRRVDRMLKSVWGRGMLDAVLAVPGYIRAGDAEGQALPGFEVRWDDDAGGDGRWAAEQANRFLAARVAVGTIDQALLGALQYRHAYFRAGVLSRNLLVVDEVHASDAYMGALLERLLDNHVAIGGRALLLSATLGAAARARLLKLLLPSLAEAQAQPYPAMSGIGVPPRAVVAAGGDGKRVAVDTAGLIADAEAIAARAVAAARTGAAVLVVRNTVAGAVAVARAVEAIDPGLAFRVNGVATLHHGRFAPDDRRLLDEAVADRFGKDRAAGGQVLVGTQTLEQSLDIDADLLITDLAPMDVLLQRIGRLHRHARTDRGVHAEARVLVLRPEDRDLTALLGRSTTRHGLGRVYADLLQLEATLRLLEEHPVIVLPRDNRRLVEGALHPEAIGALPELLRTVWRNHAAKMATHVHADRGTAGSVALDLGQEFERFAFPDDPGEAATRLGTRDRHIHLDAPLEGPFGEPVRHLSIPHHMARGIGDKEVAVRVGADGFRAGEYRYVYDRWGLRRAG